jgi:hypothetical protein
MTNDLSERDIGACHGNTERFFGQYPRLIFVIFLFFVVDFFLPRLCASACGIIKSGIRGTGYNFPVDGFLARREAALNG